MKIEILAPAGNMPSLISAVRCGANAVYLGAKNLNARKNAGNFDDYELKQAVDYCHSRDVKVFLTVNTLVGDDEMKIAYNTVKAATLCGVDGFIVQDLGLAKMIRTSFPEAKLHASTQCSVMTPDGVNALKEMGFCRVVVPRETSLEELKDLRSKTDVELELFVHGALCMSVSGQCYMSAMLGQRSGNRGLCAQPCRLTFSADNSKSCDLSLKDLSLISKIKEIETAGVISLKIEGRMKRPEYVAAAVTACKKAIDGNYNPDDERVLKSVFSRSGFTDGYFTGKRTDMFGTRVKEDVVAANDVLKELSHLYDNETPLVRVDLDFVCKKGEPITLTATALGKTVTATSVHPQIAINKPLTEEMLSVRLAKLGGTQYYAGDINVTLDDGLMVSASEINGIRRKIVEMLDEQEEHKITALPLDVIAPKQKNASPYFTARFADANQVPENHIFKRIFIPIWSRDEDFERLHAGVEIPRGLFGKEEQLKARLKELKNAGVKTALCGNLGAYKTAQSLGFEAYGDFGLNIFNSESANMYNSPILSFELSLSQANSINAPDIGIIAYGKLPLMLTRNCPVKNHIGCDKCKKQGTLTDRKGYKFGVKCSPYPCVEVLNPHPVYMADRLDEIKTDFIHFYFTDETRDEIDAVIKAYNNKAKTKADQKFTRGLYYRGVQ